MAHRRSERFKGPRKTYSIQNCQGYGQGDIGDEEEPGAAPSALSSTESSGRGHLARSSASSSNKKSAKKRPRAGGGGSSRKARKTSPAAGPTKPGTRLTLFGAFCIDMQFSSSASGLSLQFRRR